MGLTNIAVAAGIFVVGVLGAAVSRLLADEAKAWTPRAVKTLIRVAVARLPEAQRSRRDEEWQSHVNDTPGDLSKLITAVGFIIASRRIRDFSIPIIGIGKEVRIRLQLTIWLFALIFASILVQMAVRDKDTRETIIIGFAVICLLMMAAKMTVIKNPHADEREAN